MNKFYQELFGVLTRSQARRSSKAAALLHPETKEMITICRKEYEDLKTQNAPTLSNMKLGNPWQRHYKQAD